MTLDRLTAVVRELCLALNSGTVEERDRHARRAADYLGAEVYEPKAKTPFDALEAVPAPADYEPSPAVYASGEVPMVGDVICYGADELGRRRPVGIVSSVHKGEFTDEICIYYVHGGYDMAKSAYLIQRAPKAEGDYEPSEAQVEAACRGFFFTAYGIEMEGYPPTPRKGMRAALKAAHACEAKERP